MGNLFKIEIKKHVGEGGAFKVATLKLKTSTKSIISSFLCDNFVENKQHNLKLYQNIDQRMIYKRKVGKFGRIFQNREELGGFNEQIDHKSSKTTICLNHRIL